jgi:O-antigen ligase
VRDNTRGRRYSRAGLVDCGFALVPAALIVYLSFQSGGFFPGATAIAAIACLVLLGVVIATQADLLAGLTWRLAIVGGALALLCAWILISSVWSNAPARALIEFDRALLYLAVFLLFGLSRGRLRRVRWMVAAVAGALVVVGCVALTTRLAPDVWATSPGLGDDRLSYPLSYWNALGLMAGLGALLCLHLACSDREPRWLRVGGAAAVPPMAAVVVLTFSRGAIAATAVGALVYLVAARPRLGISGVLATVPATVVAVIMTLDAELVASDDYRAPAAISEGHEVAVVIALCSVGAAAMRAAALPLDVWLSRAAWSLKRGTALAAAAVLVLGAAAAAHQFELRNRLDRQVDRFVHGSGEPPPSQNRARLSDAGNPARLKQWEVALDSFRDEPVVGQGAGTFPLQWERRRTANFEVTDAHSLYLEALSELGVIGTALLAAFLLGLVGVLVELIVRCRGPDRQVFGAILAVTVAWIVHAGIDWDWEMPATAVWVVALAASALAVRRQRNAGETRASPWVRAGLCVVLAIVVVLPVRVAMSQHHLDDSVRERERGDCRRSMASARSAISDLDVRHEPFEALGYCASRLGAHRLAVSALESAADRDPDSWRPRYGLALVRASASRDPRRALAAARRRNPRSTLLRDFARRLKGARRPDWPRIARGSELPPP